MDQYRDDLVAMGFPADNVDAVLSQNPEARDLEVLVDKLVSGQFDLNANEVQQVSTSSQFRDIILDMGFPRDLVDAAITQNPDTEDMGELIDFITARTVSAAPVDPVPARNEVRRHPAESDPHVGKRPHRSRVNKGMNPGGEPWDPWEREDRRSRRSGTLYDSILKEEAKKGGFEVGGGVQVQAEPESDEEPTIDSVWRNAKQFADNGGSVEIKKPDFVGTGRSADGSKQSHIAAPPEPLTKNLVFYRNGIEVEGQTFISSESPEYLQTMDSIQRNMVPITILTPEEIRTSAPVKMSMTRRDEEDYTPPKPKREPFEGTGQSIGNSTPTGAAKAPIQPGKPINIDASQPIVKFKVRTASGVKLVECNPTTTLESIASFLGVDKLMCPFPKTEVNLEGGDVAGAKLANKMWTA
ncbi:SEP domain [Carpediemonas membranifera]|uniref:SEP domain n=1 Tax=Carpediemonas membranifera TaxID=201153 RepID=A0A8J6B005_9EUKA|nr:SEP domain [Carpediemonas membranifera]|eukprot:KAG9389999.1 SEP domain [Carpediemonas membranifera]